MIPNLEDIASEVQTMLGIVCLASEGNNPEPGQEHRCAVYQCTDMMLILARDFTHMHICHV